MTGGELFERIQKRGDSPFTERGKVLLLDHSKYCYNITNSAIITLNLLVIPNKDGKPVVWGKGRFVTYCGLSLRASNCQFPHTLSLPNQS